MCRPVTCKKCGKTTWAGCGQHVDQVMSKVPESNRCTCPRDDADGGNRGGMMSRVFSRRANVGS